jgi:hypothetical protein
MTVDLKEILDAQRDRANARGPLCSAAELKAESHISAMADEIRSLRTYAPKTGGARVHYGPLWEGDRGLSACRKYKRTRRDFLKVPDYFTEDFSNVSCISCARSSTMRDARELAERVPL